MKRTLLAILFTTLSASAFAAPGLFLGLTYNFDSSGLGLSFKILSTRRQDRPAVGVGVSYMPYIQNRFGADVSAGYVFNHGAVTAGWDFINDEPQMGLGYVNTKK